MVSSRKTVVATIFSGLVSALFLLVIVFPTVSYSCDETLLLLLTSGDPSSEFSRSIRSFNSSLARLGEALNAEQISQIPQLLAKAMEAWLAFSLRYALSPPPEAANDPDWIEKMQDTGKAVGSIRKKVSDGNISAAHSEVLALSGSMGIFFEATGLSEHQRIFLLVSRALTTTKLGILEKDIPTAAEAVNSVGQLLAQLEADLPESGRDAWSDLQATLARLDSILSNGKELDPEAGILFHSLQNRVIDVRSHILMNEWFPDLTGN